MTNDRTGSRFTVDEINEIIKNIRENEKNGGQLTDTCDSIKDKDNGGPAYPCETPSGMTYSYGMTLRDYFSGQALAGTAGDPFSTPKEVAKEAYRFADAMIEARK